MPYNSFASCACSSYTES